MRGKRIIEIKRRQMKENKQEKINLRKKENGKERKIIIVPLPRKQEKLTKIKVEKKKKEKSIEPPSRNK